MGALNRGYKDLACWRSGVSIERRLALQAHSEYIQAEGLDRLIDFETDLDFVEGVFDAVSGKLKKPFPPEPADLVRLHRMVRERFSFTVLEFGVGYSTLVLADALAKNEREWESIPDKPAVRNRFMFQLFSVDASDQWIEATRARLPAHLAERVHFWRSDVEAGTFQGRICHFYTRLPDIVADFYYLDGPSPKDVKGDVRGLSFQCDERTVMGADLLVMEPTLLPGTVILVDGRTNNARFLQRNFQRNWKMEWNPQEDYTVFELDEPRLGKYNVLGKDFRQV